MPGDSVIMRPVMWEHLPIGKLNALPTNGVPITSKSWGDLHEAYVDVTKGLYRELLRLGRPPQASATANISFATGHIRVESTTFIFEGSEADFDQAEFLESLRRKVGTNTEKVIIVSIKKGSVRVTLEGDGEELTRIVRAFLGSIDLRQYFSSTSRLSGHYLQARRSGVFTQPPARATSDSDESSPCCRCSQHPEYSSRWPLGCCGCGARSSCGCRDHWRFLRDRWQLWF